MTELSMPEEGARLLDQERLRLLVGSRPIGKIEFDGIVEHMLLAAAWAKRLASA